MILPMIITTLMIMIYLSKYLIDITYFISGYYKYGKLNLVFIICNYTL